MKIINVLTGWGIAVVLAAILAQSGCVQSPTPAITGAASNESVFVDHHVHLLSPQLVADWKSLGVPFSRPDSVYTSAAVVFGTTGDGTETPRVRNGFLLPMAHLYGAADFRRGVGLSESEEYERVQGENNHVARQAALYPDRAVPFCSVDFLRPYALAEIRRCREELGSRGFKLHLASAGTDLRDVSQLGILSDVAALAESENVVLMIHFDPQQRGVEVEDVERFIRIVLQPHPDLVVVIAHMGGSGGYGAWTQSVFATFANWLDGEAERGVDRGGLYFDLSAVWLREESEGIPQSTASDARALGRDLRRVGFERIVFGSDYPVFDPQNYAGELQAVLELSDSQWDAVSRNTVSRNAVSNNAVSNNAVSNNYVPGSWALEPDK